MLKSLVQIGADIVRLQKQTAEALRRVEDESARRAGMEARLKTLQETTTNRPPSPSANQLWNGELGHSVNSWHDSAYTTDDKAKECAFWFSNDLAVGTALAFTDARTSSANKTLKTLAYAALTAHSTYDVLFTDWLAMRGAARLMGTKTLDTPLPQNSIEAEMTVYVNFILTRRNSYIEIAEDFRIGVGLWDNTAGQCDWLKGSVGLSAAPSEAGGTTEHRYRLFIETDRNYSILTPEVVVAGGWSDAEFAAGKTVNLSWNNAAGYLRVTVWRFTPLTGVYKRLAEFSSGASTYIDNNAFEATAGGYPTGTESERKALFWSTTGNLVEMGVDGQVWDSFHALVAVPNNYDKGVTTDRQVLRIFQNKSPNLFVTGVTTNGSGIITAPAAVFENAYAALFAGLTVEVYDEDDALLATTSVSSRPSDTTLQLAAGIPAGTNRKIRVVEGGFHAILVDKIHLGFQENVSFAPNALDARTLNPVAAPSSGQGTVGGGEIPRGGGLCVALDTPVAVPDEGETPVQDLEFGCYVRGENARPNMVAQLKTGMRRTRVVRTKNGVELECTAGHRFALDEYDAAGTPLSALRVGDRVLTEIDGRRELSEIVFLSPLSDAPKPVFTPRLRGGCYYIAGRWKPNRLQKILIRLGLMKPKKGGCFSHNLKPVEL